MKNDTYTITEESVENRILRNAFLHSSKRDDIAKTPFTPPSASNSLNREWPSFTKVDDDFRLLHARYDIYGVDLASQRRGIGSLITLAKRVLRRFLSPILRQQVEFNASATRALSLLRQREDATESILWPVSCQLEQAQAQLISLLQLQTKVTAVVNDQARLTSLLQKEQEERRQENSLTQKNMSEIRTALAKTEGLALTISEIQEGLAKLEDTASTVLEMREALKKLEEAESLHSGLLNTRLEDAASTLLEMRETFKKLEEAESLHSGLLNIGSRTKTCGAAAHEASSCFDPDGLHDWYPRAILGPSTIGRQAMSSESLSKVVKVLRRLKPDDVITYLLSYYELAKKRYGDAWVFADIATVLVSISQLMQPQNYLEVGVFHGRSMAMLAANCTQCEIYGFDLWVEGYAGLNNPGPDYVRQQLKRVGHRGPLTLISGNSHETLPRFFAEHPDLYFDVITVDGDHTYEGAAQDLRDVMPRLRTGGLLVFDDLACPGTEYLSRVWAEVVLAAPDFTAWDFRELGNGVAVGMKL